MHFLFSIIIEFVLTKRDVHHKIMATNHVEPFVLSVYLKSRKSKYHQIKIHTGIPTIIRIITTVVISMLLHRQSFEKLFDPGLIIKLTTYG